MTTRQQKDRPRGRLHPALNTVNQWLLKRALMAKCWDHPKLCNKRRRSQHETSRRRLSVSWSSSLFGENIHGTEHSVCESQVGLTDQVGVSRGINVGSGSCGDSCGDDNGSYTAHPLVVTSMASSMVSRTDLSHSTKIFFSL